MLNILQDFYNLVDVYLDAVFFPKCVEDFQTFQQEGWHYELNNPEEDISYKGCLLDLLCYKFVYFLSTIDLLFIKGIEICSCIKHVMKALVFGKF